MQQVIELYNIIIKPEAYGVLFVIILYQLTPKFKILNKALSEYVEIVNIVREIKTNIQVGAVTNKDNHDSIYRTLRDYSQDIKGDLKDILNVINAHCLTVKPDFDNINNKLDDVEENTADIVNKILSQSTVMEALSKINSNIEKMDQLIMVLFTHINNSNINGFKQTSNVGSTSGMSEIKF